MARRILLFFAVLTASTCGIAAFVQANWMCRDIADPAFAWSENEGVWIGNSRLSWTSGWMLAFDEDAKAWIYYAEMYGPRYPVDSIPGTLGDLELLLTGSGTNLIYRTSAYEYTTNDIPGGSGGDDTNETDTVYTYLPLRGSKTPVLLRGAAELILRDE